MKLNKRRALFLAFAITALCSLLVVFPMLNPSPDLPVKSDYLVAVEKAIAFFEGSRDPYALLFLDVIYRRFGILEFADALQRFDEEIFSNPLIAPTMSVFRRIADNNNQPAPSDFYEANKQGETNIFVIPALYCDRLGLPINYPEMLEEAAKKGGYNLTHVLLAWIWIQENGCDVVMSQDFVEDMYRANAELINSDSFVYDIELEAAAFLCLAGQGERVDNAFIERVIANQNADGSWDSPDIEKWHSTVLGLMLLIHLQFPSDSYPPMLAPASP